MTFPFFTGKLHVCTFYVSLEDSNQYFERATIYICSSPPKTHTKRQLNLTFPPPPLKTLSVAIYTTAYPGGHITNKAQRRRYADGLLFLLLGRRHVPGERCRTPPARLQPLQGLLRRDVPCTGSTQTIVRSRIDASE